MYWPYFWPEAVRVISIHGQKLLTFSTVSTLLDSGPVNAETTRALQNKTQDSDNEAWMVVEKSTFKTLCKKHVIQNCLLLL